ncbi:MAG: hypothetical protein OJF50_001316 [Nitrospira sp.]|nr:hypothetical protein [Nitrospira sp.]
MVMQQLIEAETVMAYCSRTKVAYYTDRNWQIQLLCGSA